jgi:hypothetical protein
MGTLSTVNVIEFMDSARTSIGSLASFDDTTKEGNEEAEQRFTELANDHGIFDPDAISEALEDGFLEVGVWMVAITHSTVTIPTQIKGGCHICGRDH